MILELKENRSHGTREYPYDQYYMRNMHHAFQIPVHWHDEVEIIYIEKGRLHVKIGEVEYEGQEEDIFFVNPRELHLMRSEDANVQYYTILFPMEFLSFQTMDWLDTQVLAPLRSGQLLFLEKVEDENIKKRLLPFLRQVAEENSFLNRRSKGSRERENIRSHPENYVRAQFQTRILLIEILQCLYEEGQLRKVGNGENNNLQKQLLLYIQEHYTEDIRLETLAKEFHLSQKYISRYFVEHFHLPFSHYVMHLRLCHARKLLETTDLPVTDIAFEAGFSNVSYFIRSFKRSYELSPLKYRRQYER